MGFSGSGPGPNSITTAMLQAGAVTTTKIANNAVGSGQLGAGAVTLAALAAGLGNAVLLYDDETEITASVTTASIKSYSLPNNNYTKILIQAEVGYDLLLAAENISWDIQVGGVTKRHLDVECGSSSGFSRCWPIAVTFVQQTAASIAINLTVNAGTANCRIFSLRVYGIV
ncbi:MAG TPA: hypothetical protein VNW25_04005 [Candidatus Sulfotelmatobacter sp.]|jgi:hypothetical protein|nr:hypothetical protein [Candidatus Sulfotelmatobacter sp.]